MPFVKGDSNINRGGRPLGKPNPPNSLRVALRSATEDHLPKMLEALQELRETNVPKYIEYYLRLLEYTTPKLMHIKSDIDVADGAIQSIQVIMKNKDQEEITPIEIT
jgi:hypothetical protein